MSKNLSLWTISNFLLAIVFAPAVFGQDDGDWSTNRFLLTTSDGLVLNIKALSPACCQFETETRVGIGLERPNAPLHVTGSTLLATVNGRVGIGTSNPAFQLSLGRSLARTKLAIFENGLNNSYGIGVVPGTFRFHLNGSGARFAFFNSDETNANEIFTVFGTGKTRVQILEVTGGADVAETFEFTNAESIYPGMVVSIDPDRAGQMLLSTKPYDRTVAGVVSGAKGLAPGLTLRPEADASDAKHPVALAGLVYTWVDSSSGPIRPGDLLTTSDTPGHAMKVTEYTKAQGAIIGKAMGSLESGRGLILVLVSLQ